MTVIVSNQPGSTYSGGDKPTWEVPFNIEGTNENIEARIQLTLQSPGTYDGLYRQSVRVEHEGYNFYKGTVTYGTNDTQPDEGGSISYQFEIGGKTEKIKQSLSTVRYPSTAPDYKGLIGVSEDNGEILVEGVNFYGACYAFTLKCRFPASYFTIDRRNYIYLCSCAPINSVPYWGFNAGEVHFVSASGGLKLGDEYGDIDFKFEVSPNYTGLSVGDISGIAKGGWQYLDLHLVTVEETLSGVKKLIKKVDAAYVHTLLEASNFLSLLGV